MDLTYVDEYCESSGEANDADEEPKVKRRRLNRIWVERELFESPEEAKVAVETKRIWKVSSTKETTSGTRVNYRCTLGQYRSLECRAGLYLLYHSTSNRVSLFVTENDHENHQTNPKRGLASNVKTFIRQKYGEGKNI